MLTRACHRPGIKSGDWGRRWLEHRQATGLVAVACGQKPKHAESTHSFLRELGRLDGDIQPVIALRAKQSTAPKRAGTRT